MLGVASTFLWRSGTQKLSSCLKCSYQGEINTRINDWVGKKLNCGFSHTMTLKFIHCFDKAFSRKAGNTYAENEDAAETFSLLVS